MALIEKEEAAQRLARAIASDLAQYNDQKITAGIENDNLFETLKEEIDEGRALLQTRVAPALLDRARWYFERALNDFLIRPRANLRSKMW